MKKQCAVASAVGIVSALCMTANARTLYWTGSEGSSWDDSTANWTNDIGEAVTFNARNDYAVFDDTAQTRTVLLTCGGISPDGIIFNNTLDYELDTKDPDCCFGWYCGGFTKNGSGKVVVKDANKGYRVTIACGKVEVNEGELNFAYGHYLKYALGSKITVADGATFRIGAVDLYSGDNMNYGSVLPTSPITVEKGGMFIIEDASGSWGAFGPLTFNDSSCFDFSKATGNAGGIFLFAGKVTLNGTGEPYDWDYTKTLCAQEWNGRITLRNGESPVEFQVADVTESDATDFLLRMPLADQGRVAGRAGFIKSGPGTMHIKSHASTFTGDIDVRQGDLIVGRDTQVWNALAYHDPTYLGYMDRNADRKIKIGAGSTLLFTDSFALGAVDSAYCEPKSSITNDHLVGEFVLDGATLSIKDTQSMAFPSLTFKNGATMTSGYGVADIGRIRLLGTFKVEKDITNTPFVLAADPERDVANISEQGLTLNGYPENTFDVADLTDDDRPDATFEVPFFISYSYFRKDTVSGGHSLDDWAFGFTKTGAGTMRYAAPSVRMATGDNVWFQTYNGDTKVNAGTLQMDGDISLSDTVRVAAGAFLSGTGTVNNVTLAAAGGLAAAARQAKPLTVKGDLVIGENPVVNVVLPTGASVEDVKANVLAVEGNVAGAENLANATVKVNGQASGMVRVSFRDGVLKVSFARGMAVIFR